MSVLNSTLMQPQKPIEKKTKKQKTFVNETKILLIPPLLIGNKFVTDSLVKENLFYHYFSQQCTTVDNGSSIPPNITFATEQKLSTFEFCIDYIVKIINRWIQIRPMDTMKYLFE